MRVNLVEDFIVDILKTFLLVFILLFTSYGLILWLIRQDEKQNTRKEVRVTAMAAITWHDEQLITRSSDTHPTGMTCEHQVIPCITENNRRLRSSEVHLKLNMEWMVKFCEEGGSRLPSEYEVSINEPESPEDEWLKSLSEKGRFGIMLEAYENDVECLQVWHAEMYRTLKELRAEAEGRDGGEGHNATDSLVKLNERGMSTNLLMLESTVDSVGRFYEREMCELYTEMMACWEFDVRKRDAEMERLNAFMKY